MLHGTLLAPFIRSVATEGSTVLVHGGHLGLSAARRLIVTLIRRLQFGERHLGLFQLLLEGVNVQAGAEVIGVQLAHQTLALRSKVGWALAFIVAGVAGGTSTVRCRVRIHLKISSLASILRRPFVLKSGASQR